MVPVAQPEPAPFDAIVIGGGFGGLGAALTLAESGARVAVLERMGYLGGCAGTFERDGLRWEAGATLCAGLAPQQLFGGWIARHKMDVALEPLAPVVTVRSRHMELAVPPDRGALVAQLVQSAPRKQKQIQHFFDIQAQVAAALWDLLDDPTLLPPWTAAALLRHSARLPRYLPLLRWLGRPLSDVLAHCDVFDVAALRHLCDVTCHITVQCPAAEAEAPLALATLDYWFRGAAHIVGGMGRLANALGQAIVQCGGEVHLFSGATAVHRHAGHWRVSTKRQQWTSRVLVANLLPDALAPMLAADGHALLARRLAAYAAPLDDGWSAMLCYLLVRPPLGPAGAHHLDLTDDSGRLTLGHHVFLSVAADSDGKAPRGLRTAVLSTHVPTRWWQALDPSAQASHADAIVARMLQTLTQRAPEWSGGIERCMTASPRTWQRFTGRPAGKVGGAPRRAGLHNYAALGPQQPAPGLWLVGDTVFPGQSALATALGGQRAATAALAWLARH